MSNNLENLSVDKLRRRKKIGLILVWILYVIAIFNLGVVGYKLGDETFEMSRIVPLVLIPAMMGIILTLGVRRINKELKRREE